MTRQLTITLPSKASSYQVSIGKDLLQFNSWIEHLAALKASVYAIITDTSIEKLYGRKLQEHLNRHNLQTVLISFPPGEESKTRATKEFCEDRLLELKAARDTCIIGLGGGIVTDLAGFVASTYCRGVPSIMIPTSLLAMVDASIGGKTGVNVPQGKNLIGTIYQPKGVLIDPSVLKSLPLSEIKNGMAEVIKYGLIASRDFLDFLKQNAKKILQGDLEAMEEAIYKSVMLKGEIIQEDEMETGKRRLLNFGHTVAHALESATHHEIPHGRAVAIGMIAESYLAMQSGRFSRADFQTVCDVIRLFQIDLTWKEKFIPSQLLDVMRYDKKSVRHTPRFVVLKEIGIPHEFNGQYCTEAEEQQIIDALEWMCSDHFCK